MKTTITMPFVVQVYNSAHRILSIVETDQGMIPLVGRGKADMATLSQELSRKTQELWSSFGEVRAKELRAYETLEDCFGHADDLIRRYTKSDRWIAKWEYSETTEVQMEVCVFPRRIKKQ